MTNLSKDQLRAQLARHNCALYASEYLSGPPEAPYNGRFFVAQHHTEWAQLLNTHKQLCINAARDSGKSYFFTMAYPIWQAERHPGKRGLILSGSQPQAERILLDIQKEIETNPNLSHLMPKSTNKRMWSSKQLRLANGHEIYARGYGTKVRGVHPIWLVVDDGLNDEDAYSEKIRERNINYFYSALRNAVIPGGQTVVVGTPYAETDLYGDLAKNSEWHFARFPGILDYGTLNERALWPERYPLSLLYKKRAEIGSIRFSREILCLAVSDDMSLFPNYLFQGEKVELGDVPLGAPRKHWDQFLLKSVYMGVDFAVSANTGADFTVVWTMGVDAKGTRYVMDIQRERGLPFTQQKELIARVAAKYKPSMIYVESNQAQRIFGDELIRETDLPIKHFFTGAEKNELEKGIPALRVLLENEKIRIPRGDDHSRAMTDLWKEEMRNMTFAEGKVMSTGAHDDCLRAGTMIRTRAGYRPIEEIVVGDEVLTHEGRYRQVEKVLAKPFDGKFFTMRIGSSLSLDVSYNHPVLAAKATGPTDRAAAFLETDWTFPGDWNLKTQRVVSVRAPVAAADAAATLHSREFYSAEGDVYTEVHAVPLDSGLARFLGRFLADGNCSNSGLYVMSLAFHADDESWRWFQEYLTGLGVKSRYTVTRGKAAVLVFSSKLLWTALRACYTQEDEKQAPFWMDRLSAFNDSILTEWLNGDGWYNPAGHHVGVSTSKSLALSMRDLALGLNLRASLRKVTRHRYERPTKDQYWLEIRPARKTAWNTNIGDVRHLANGRSVFPVRSVSPYNYTGTVYNLQVAEDRSFVANGIVVHNCVMAFWICNKAIADSNFTFTFSEQEGDDVALKVRDQYDTEAVERLTVDGNFVLGAVDHFGRPRKVNAQLTDGVSQAQEDELESKKKELKPYAEVKPQDRIPTVSEMFGFFRR